ncbi:MAG: polysaccharide biosynthesis tyrosine autokinase [Gemmatimonadetes bacterium]|nr:polysaccharide biosynthesis tyrosine autokinase [Gemmatimonadota bacterium]
MDAVTRREGTEALRRIVHQREVHLRDLVGVVSRHWRLVALLTVLVTVGAGYSARKQVPRYQSRLTVQVSSPKQVFAQLEGMRVDELALQTDPVLSEALILTTQQLALEVVRNLALQLELDDPGLRRGDLFAAVAVEWAAPPGAYRLTVQPTGGFELRDASGAMVAQGLAGEPIVGPGFTLRLVPSAEARTVEFQVDRPEEAAAWVSGGLSYDVREGTNAVDISFGGTDPTLVPQILNAAAVALRLDGVRRAQEIAARKRIYVAEQLANADSSYRDKLAELQRFKEGEQITDLSIEEQAVVQSIQALEQQRQQLAVQMVTLRQALGEAADSIGVETLNRLAAVQDIGQNPALGFQIQNLLTLYEQRRTVTAGALGLRERNPQVDALNQRIREAYQALRSAVGAALESLESRRRALDQRIAGGRARLRTFPGKESRIAQLQLEASILNDTYRYLLTEYESARLVEATIGPYINLLDPASPAFRVGTTLRQKVVLGMLVGLLLGLGGAFFLEYLDQTIKNAGDVERVIGIPVLGLIPYDPELARSGNGKRPPITVVTRQAGDRPAAEAFRALRTNVTFVGAEKPLQFVSVTSPGPGEGKSTTAVNLAVALAQGGQRTLLIDGDLRRPLIHRTFALVQEPGLTDVLVGRATAREAIRPEVAPGLDVLPSGSIPPNPSELLGSSAMHSLISGLRRDYHYIIIDTPPTLPVTDASVVASSADAAILVLRSGDTEETAAQRALEQLRRVRARIAGAVLNAVSPRHDRYYTYYSYRQEPARRRGLRSIRSIISNSL